MSSTMRELLVTFAGVLVLGSSCAKEFYCEDKPNDDDIRYCYAAPSECGSQDKDVLTDKPRAVTCSKEMSAWCRPDPDRGRVCTTSETECEASIPRGLTDTRTGQPPPCKWVH